MVTLAFLIAIIGGIWGVLTLLGFHFSEAKCSSCKMYGEKDYMIQITSKDYKHYSCRFDPPYFTPSHKKINNSSHGSE